MQSKTQLYYNCDALRDLYHLHNLVPFGIYYRHTCCKSKAFDANISLEFHGLFLDMLKALYREQLMKQTKIHKRTRPRSTPDSAVNAEINYIG